jgi:hypothetical protein
MTWRTIRQALWSIDALLVVLADTAFLLLLPVPKTKLPVIGTNEWEHLCSAVSYVRYASIEIRHAISER